MIVASDLPVQDVLPAYQQRWGVEGTFAALKARGLGLEATYLTAPDRLSRLFGLLSIMLAWLVRMGDDLQTTTPPAVDNRGRRFTRTARLGWMRLSQAVRWGLDSFWTYVELLKTPFPAPSAGKLRSVSC